MNHLYFIIGLTIALATCPGLMEIMGDSVKSTLLALFLIMLIIFLWPIPAILAIILVLISNEF